jgi:hypothetical protein
MQKKPGDAFSDSLFIIISPDQFLKIFESCSWYIAWKRLFHVPEKADWFFKIVNP